MTMIIELTKGQQTIVSDEDFEWLSRLNWCVHTRVSGQFSAKRGTTHNGKVKTIHMHREIMTRMLGRDLLPTEEVDHIDMNPLNNTRENLRLASRKQQERNRGKYTNNTSGFKGVFRSTAKSEKWFAQIRVDGRGVYLGSFDTPEEAAKAYDTAARELHGEFARLNFSDHQ